MQSLEQWIESLFADQDLRGMGHAQSVEDLNLGLGWLYYGLVRLYRTRRAVVIGSYRGFVPMVLARAMQDNQTAGEVIFIDPSLADPFWQNAEQVRAHFAAYGIDSVRHYLSTTQDFVMTDAYQALNDIDLLFVDGYHTYAQAKFDHTAFVPKLSEDAVVMFHDSVRHKLSSMYGQDRRYEHTVYRYLQELKQDPGLQVIDFSQDAGLSIVKRAL